MTTRLHECCKSGDVEEAHKLIKAGSHDIDVEDMHGRTPLAAACYFGHREMVKYLVVNGACMHTAASGVTPVHRAVCRNKGEIVKMLVAGGCSLNAKTGEGETPLQWAHKFDRKEIAAFLEDITAHSEHLDGIRKELGLTDIRDNFLPPEVKQPEESDDDWTAEEQQAANSTHTRRYSDHLGAHNTHHEPVEAASWWNDDDAE